MFKLVVGLGMSLLVDAGVGSVAAHAPESCRHLEGRTAIMMKMTFRMQIGLTVLSSCLERRSLLPGEAAWIHSWLLRCLIRCQSPVAQNKHFEVLRSVFLRRESGSAAPWDELGMRFASLGYTKLVPPLPAKHKASKCSLG